jgi:hypothetical protein
MTKEERKRKRAELMMDSRRLVDVRWHSTDTGDFVIPRSGNVYNIEVFEIWEQCSSHVVIRFVPVVYIHLTWKFIACPCRRAHRKP